MRRAESTLAAGVLAIAVCSLAQGAAAQSKIVVLKFEGPSAGDVREGVVDALSSADGIAIVGREEVEKTAHGMGADIGTDPGRAMVAAKLSIAGFITGTIKKQGASLVLELQVWSGKDGTLVGEAKLRARKDALARHAKKEALSELSPQLAKLQPAAPPPPAVQVTEEPEPVERPAPPPPPPPPLEPAEESEPEPDQRAKPRAFELFGGARVMTRSYRYTDHLLQIGVHNLDPTPAFRLEARWYPGAHVTRSFAANIGLDLSLQALWPVEAHRDNLAFKTTGLAFGVGARVRVPIKEHEIGFIAGYGGQSLSIGDSHGQDPGVPSVSYGFVRLGADGRAALSKSFALSLRAAYLLLASYGELAQPAWFQHVGGGGLEAELALAYAFTPLLGVRVGGGFARYFMSLDPQPTDAGVRLYGRIAGGLTDQYFYGLLGLELHP